MHDNDEKYMNDESIDIITIHEDIMTHFANIKAQISELSEQLRLVNDGLKNEKITDRTFTKLKDAQTSIEKKIRAHDYYNTYNFYMFDSIPLINEYKAILNKPVKISFLTKTTVDDECDNKNDKKAIIKKYICMLNKYGLKKDIDVYQEHTSAMTCGECGSKDFDENGSIHTCVDCGLQITIVSVVSCFKDIDRINITNKYMYDRRVHFRECMNQYQSKPNQIVPEEVFRDIIHLLEVHGLRDPSMIKKEHIHMFLKELGHVKYYDDISYIHHRITGKKSADISHLEDKLMEDFNTLTVAYDKKYKDCNSFKRKNFINVQCVLYQLLRKYKFPCAYKDFNLIKTLDRKSKHDDIISDLFYILGWNYTHIF